MVPIQQIAEHTQQDYKLYLLVMAGLQFAAWLFSFVFGQWVKTPTMSPGRVRFWANAGGIAIITWAGFRVLHMTWIDVAAWSFINVVMYQRMINRMFDYSRDHQHESKPAMFLYYFLRPSKPKRKGAERREGRRIGESYRGTDQDSEPITELKGVEDKTTITKRF